MEYQTAIRGAFFDIARVCDSADAIAQHARYLEDGLLFIQNGKILAQMPWQEIFATLKEVSYREYITMESFVLMGCQTALNVSVWRDLSRGGGLEGLVNDARNGAQFVRSFLV